MGEKLTAANLLKGRKMNYAKSVSHPFLGDYVRLRSNSEWRRVAKQDNSVVFADIVNKISRSGGKVCLGYALSIFQNDPFVISN